MPTRDQIMKMGRAKRWLKVGALATANGKTGTIKRMDYDSNGSPFVELEINDGRGTLICFDIEGVRALKVEAPKIVLPPAEPKKDQDIATLLRSAVHGSYWRTRNGAKAMRTTSRPTNDEWPLAFEADKSCFSDFANRLHAHDGQTAWWTVRLDGLRGEDQTGESDIVAPWSGGDEYQKEQEQRRAPSPTLETLLRAAKPGSKWKLANGSILELIEINDDHPSYPVKCEVIECLENCRLHQGYIDRWKYDGGWRITGELPELDIVGPWEQPDEKKDQEPEQEGQDMGAGTSETELAAKLVEILARPKQPAVDEEKLREMVRTEIGNQVPRRVEIKAPGQKPKDMGVQHAQFEMLTKVVGARVHVFLSGPAGSGKTTACEKAAEALGLEWVMISVGPQTTKYDLIGFVQPTNGVYCEGPLYDAYKNGKVLVLDEVDAGNPAVLTVINAALANGHFRFPNNETIKRHENFVCIACGNTWGQGASVQYVGRNKLDAATLDRFVRLFWQYDEAFECALAGVKPKKKFKLREYAHPAAIEHDAETWTARVQTIRAKADSLGLHVVISPRATLHGLKLMAAGINGPALEQCCIFEGMDVDTQKKLVAA